MALKIKFIKNSNGERRQFQGSTRIDPVVVGKAIKAGSHPGMKYYFADGVVKVSHPSSITINITNPVDEQSETECFAGRDYQSNSSGDWKMLEMFYASFNALGDYDIKRHICFTVPENLDITKLGDPEYLLQYVSYPILNCDTTSPDYVIENGYIECIAVHKVKNFLSYAALMCIHNSKAYGISKAKMQVGNFEESPLWVKRLLSSSNSNYKIIRFYGSKYPSKYNKKVFTRVKYFSGTGYWAVCA